MIMFGYVDPGSGALIWQMLAAAAVGAIFYFRSFFQGIGRLFRRLLGKGNPGEAQPPAAQQNKKP